MIGLSLAFGTPASADFRSCVADLRPLAASRGVSAATFEAATADLTENPEVLGFLDSQPEFRTPVWDYLAGLVDDERIADGRAMEAKWGSTLAGVERRFGVDPATVTAVWGVESDYGRSFGFRPIVQSLATLSCSGRRQAYFRQEFAAALEIIEHGDVDPKQFTGSWAGAFGHTQFMPSTFLRMAVDVEGRGSRDVIDSVPNALGSTANFLRKNGWVPGLHWGYEVRLPEGYAGPSGRGAKHPASFWKAKGVGRIDDRALEDAAYGLLLPAGARGPAFLVSKNFDVIYSYNAAETYALAIATLSDRLEGGGPLVTPWPTGDRGLSRVERREVQGLLADRGYAIGNRDGVMGTKTREAIADFQGRQGLARDGRAGGAVLDLLRSGR